MDEETDEGMANIENMIQNFGKPMTLDMIKTPENLTQFISEMDKASASFEELRGVISKGVEFSSQGFDTSQLTGVLDASLEKARSNIE